MTVQALQNRITSSEFVEWNQFLKGEREFHTKEDYYLAQIASEVRRGLVKNPSRVKMKDFLLVFYSGKKPGGSSLVDSKAFWLGTLGISTNTLGGRRNARTG